MPTWPIKDNKGLTIDRAQLARTFQPWGELAAHRVPIHFGEMGCYKHTPPEVVLPWFDDTLSVLGDLRSELMTFFVRLFVEQGYKGA